MPLFSNCIGASPKKVKKTNKQPNPSNNEYDFLYSNLQSNAWTGFPKEWESAL